LLNDRLLWKHCCLYALITVHDEDQPTLHDTQTNRTHPAKSSPSALPSPLKNANTALTMIAVANAMRLSAFTSRSINQYIDIYKKLKGENDQEIRMQLIREARALEDGF